VDRSSETTLSTYNTQMNWIVCPGFPTPLDRMTLTLTANSGNTGTVGVSGALACTPLCTGVHMQHHIQHGS